MPTRLFGPRLRELRLRLGRSQAEIARAARISERHLIRLEQNERSPTLKVLGELARAFRLDFLAFVAATCVAAPPPDPAVIERDVRMAGDVLLITLTGVLGAANLSAHTADIIRLGRRYGAQKICVDMAAVEVRMDYPERYDGSLRAAGMFASEGYAPRIAVVGSAAFEADQWGAARAEERGLKVKVFASQPEALVSLQDNELWVTLHD